MPYDFLNEIDRKNTHAEKYELAKQLFGSESVQPMWVADMDIPTPKFIIDAVKSRLDHPVLGYTLADDKTYQAIIEWQARYDYQVDKQEILFTHNVANGFHIAIQACTQPGESILVFTPIYPPFLTAPVSNHRNVLEQPLVGDENGYYQIDYAQLERNLTNEDVTALLLCHPHNPVGRSWSEDELVKIVELCDKYDVIIISDEIHADLTYPPHQHKPLASLSGKAKDITITLNSPGKTFNLGGLQIGYAIIANKPLRESYQACLNQVSINGLSCFGYEAIKAAYSNEGWLWKQELLNHLQSNINAFIKAIEEKHQEVIIQPPQATYLVWMNFKNVFSNQTDLKNWWALNVGLGLSNGKAFGGEFNTGEGCMRINLAVSEETLVRVIEEIKQA